MIMFFNHIFKICMIGPPSLWYITYKVFITILLCCLTTAHVVSTVDRLGTKWLIFLTNQGMLLLILHNLVHLFIIMKKRLFPSPLHLPQLPLIYKISWSLQTITSALFISILYWSLVHRYVVEHKLLLNPADWVYNFFLHAFNTVSCLLDLLLSARPISLFHAYLPVIFGLIYSLFSLIYWLCGGK